MIVLLCTCVCLLVCYASLGRRKPIRFNNTLVIGGTSGLGRAFASLLHMKGHRVTITSRSHASAVEAAKDLEAEYPGPHGISALAVDITQDKPFEEATTDFDTIFCVPGFCVAKYFRDQTSDEISNQIDLNFTSVIKSLLHFRQYNKKPFTFVMIGSTAALFQFPGYASYAPSKSALLSFTCATYLELARENIDLRLYLCAAMATQGLAKEDEAKPEYTKEIEYSNTVQKPLIAAECFFQNAGARKIITSDWFTYLCLIKMNCEEAVDYLLFPLAVVVVFAAKLFVIRKFSSVKLEEFGGRKNE